MIARRRRPSGKLRDADDCSVLGYPLHRDTLTPIRTMIDTDKPGDYGADPLGGDPPMYRMVPSGDIVDYTNRVRRLQR